MFRMFRRVIPPQVIENTIGTSVIAGCASVLMSCITQLITDSQPPECREEFSLSGMYPCILAEKGMLSLIVHTMVVGATLGFLYEVKLHDLRMEIEPRRRPAPRR